MTGDSARLPDLEAGTSVGEYVVKRKIGEGGMGQVYAGEQPMIGKQVAIKVLSSELAQDPNLEQRLLEEARAVNLIHHPNIIDIFSFGTLADHRPYFVMEYLEGENLEDALCRNAVSPTDLISLVEQLCQGLGAAHAAGFVHRDLKPENLWLVHRPGQAPFLKILDFGIAKNTRLPSPGLTTQGQVMGTAHYMAPEQVLARPVDGRADIYAVGIILYRILAGVLPFDAPNTYAIVTKHVGEPPQPISSHRRVPAELEAGVMRCLAKEPAERPQTASQLWSELRPGLAAWQRGNSDVGLAVTMGSPAQVVTVTGPVTKATFIEKPQQETRMGTRGGRRLVVAGIVATVTILVGVGLSLVRAKPTAQQPPTAAILPSSRDGASLSAPSPVTQLAPVQVHGERDSGVGAATKPPSRPPAPHPAKKTTHDYGTPIRL
jgi:serine/threonine-protein kinase